jgi:hypothetical protein
VHHLLDCSILVGRRQKLLARYLSRLSPLALPTLRPERGGTDLCTTDLSVLAGVSPMLRYRASFATAPGAEQLPLDVRSVEGSELCVRLPSADVAAEPRYLMLELAPAEQSRPGPNRFHLYAFGSRRWLVAGLERLDV